MLVQRLFINLVLQRHVRIVQLTNSNVLGKFPIRDSNSRVNWKLLLVDLTKIQYTLILILLYNIIIKCPKSTLNHTVNVLMYISTNHEKTNFTQRG